MVSVKVDDPAGRIDDICVVEETGNAVVLYVNLGEKYARVSCWCDRIAYIGDEPVTTITLEGDELGDHPVGAADTSRYTMILTWARSDAFGEGREIYSREGDR